MTNQVHVASKCSTLQRPSSTSRRQHGTTYNMQGAKMPSLCQGWTCLGSLDHMLVTWPNVLCAVKADWSFWATRIKPYNMKVAKMLWVYLKLLGRSGSHAGHMGAAWSKQAYAIMVAKMHPAHYKLIGLSDHMLVTWPIVCCAAKSWLTSLTSFCRKSGGPGAWSIPLVSFFESGLWSKRGGGRWCMGGGGGGGATPPDCIICSCCSLLRSSSSSRMRSSSCFIISTDETKNGSSHRRAEEKLWVVLHWQAVVKSRTAKAGKKFPRKSRRKNALCRPVPEVLSDSCNLQIYWLGSSMTNREPMHYQSITIRGCSYQLVDEDRTILVPTQCSSYIRVDIKHTIVDVSAH